MKSKIPNLKLKIALALCLSSLANLCAQQFILNFPLSPSDQTLSATGSVSAYVASWSPTNGTRPTNWTIFARANAGTSNIVINSTVPSPAYILVQSKNTNGVLSANTNYLLYNTNALWIYVSNNFVPPPPPGSLMITN